MLILRVPRMSTIEEQKQAIYDASKSIARERDRDNRLKSEDESKCVLEDMVINCVKFTYQLDTKVDTLSQPVKEIADFIWKICAEADITKL